MNFIDDGGVPLSVTLLGIGSVSSQTVNRDLGATVILEATADTGSTSEGWVDTALPPGVVGYAVFRQSVQGRADDTLFNISVAFLNPSDQQTTVKVFAYCTDSSQIGFTQVSLAPHATLHPQSPGL